MEYHWVYYTVINCKMLSADLPGIRTEGVGNQTPKIQNILPPTAVKGNKSSRRQATGINPALTDD